MSGLGLTMHNLPNRPDWAGQAGNYYQQASGTFAGMDRKQETKTTQEQSAGGTLGNVAGGAMAGFQVGGPWGAVVGGAVGLLGSFL